ncbi:hypothetical protein AB0I22_28010 [Streptomyces sp. NPDC050610]|uniref:effector-associated constant component EACC1 n=1 Tax=Streptomyces sp. NPDC050610 TaxID=3157097 RepID=UPI003436A7AB
MLIEIGITGDDAEAELRSLRDWLADEPDIRRHTQITLAAAEPEPGDMGSALDLIKLVADEGFQLANLAIAYAAWKATRSRRSNVSVRRDGEPVPLDEAQADGPGSDQAAPGEQD